MHKDYDGEERRIYDARISVLCERLDRFIDTTTDYRKSLCAKLDIITDRVNQLPCKGREVEMKTVKTDVNQLQLAAKFVIAGLFAMGVAWGAVSNTVAANTKKWAILEPEHKELIKDVEVLKEKSYGYRGIPLEGHK